MKIYKSITQDGAGQLLVRYGVVDHTGNVEMDFDVLQDYAIYPHDNSSYIAEYLPTGTAYGAFTTLEEALEAILKKVNNKKQLTESTSNKVEQFQKIVGASSLDQRYANVVVEKKQKTNEQLREKYAVARMNTTARLNRAYFDRLLDH